MSWYSLIWWLLFSAANGLQDAVFYHMADYSRQPVKFTHGWSVVMRLFAACAILDSTKPGKWAMELIVLGMTFSLFHNGFYYQARRAFGVKEYNFFSDSDTSKALFDFTFAERALLFVTGILLYWFCFIYKN